MYIGGHNMFTLIAGPCAMESEEICMQTATEIKRITDKLGIPYVYKTSFDKANRTSISSYRGLGMEEGLRILQKVKDEVGVKVTTDIHESWQAEPVAKVVDILQIPAFLCRQTDLLVAAAKTGKTVNVKKAQFLAPWDMKNVVGKLEDSGCKDIMVCERGTTFGYNNFVVDMTSLVEMKSFGYPVVFDATHSVQKPGGKGTSSDGNREFVEYLAKAAIAVGVDALFMEVHPDPDNAKCDGPNMVKLSDLEGLLTKLVDIYNAINK
ncbi:MAG: 3-deoxy-8-phosphooctulonate synthase [Intestinibacter bartlettii]|nr:3-deoxy-8-phosphooctulonate synthase [Intestinibacter bartlettii]MCC2707595.1 3-deoxy-8-phosphooctulonate synthase [Intestinibacter bartlettii]MCC2763045.1 3-deoxy-8-phosphooctulonate synthase [Intestinibacter bartlettii]MDU2693459.1 3-deoxy-8-phosphooctulonate synthase [Intestinibacter bartlettii]MEE0615844.1 3-deoxy-8-phosphooctulonate synthase [Intestinibacter bartlettii]